MATNYIDRNALIEHIRKDPLFDLVEQYGITGVIESFPAADGQPVKHGRWQDNRHSDNVMVCSVCGVVRENGNFKYCPDCGAKMDGAE
jgi:rubrerythrin